MSERPTGKVASIVVDTTEDQFETLIDFWKAILGLEEKVRYPNFVWLGRVASSMLGRFAAASAGSITWRQTRTLGLVSSNRRRPVVLSSTGDTGVSIASN